MAAIDTGTINFAVYEDAVEYLGMAEVTLPDIELMSEAIKGAGISGEFNAPYLGHTSAMTASINFRTVNENASKLLEPRNHQLEFRASQQYRENSTGEVTTKAVKYVLIAQPTKLGLGKLAPASPADVSGEYSITYLFMSLNGKKNIEIDILNFIFYVNGVDYLEKVRKDLGK
jgi:P2 family phage contractile tail tube protein